MKRARDAYPSNYAAAVARKKARTTPAVRAEVARQIRNTTDLKVTDATTVATVIPAAGTVYNATQSLIRGANGFDQFAGNQITPTGFSMKFQVTNGATNNFSFLRVMCVQWFDASVPTPTGLLQSITAPNGPISAISITNKSQMRVLYDKTYGVNALAGDGVTNANSCLTGSFYIPNSKLKRMRFNAVTAAIQDGGIYTLFISDKTTGPSVSLYSRLSFTDA